MSGGSPDNPDLCPGCEDIPGFDKKRFEFSYDDKGCTGKFENFQRAPLKFSSDENGPVSRKNQAYMRRWLTPAVFDYLGLLYLQHARKVLRIE